MQSFADVGTLTNVLLVLPALDVLGLQLLQIVLPLQKILGPLLDHGQALPVLIFVLVLQVQYWLLCGLALGFVHAVVDSVLYVA